MIIVARQELFFCIQMKLIHLIYVGSYDTILVNNISILFKSLVKGKKNLGSLDRKCKKSGKIICNPLNLHMNFGAEHTECDYVPWMIMG